MITIRPGVFDDLPALTDTYNHYIVHTPITFDVRMFTPGERRPWFDDHSIGGRHRLLVAEDPAADSYRVRRSGQVRVRLQARLHADRRARVKDSAADTPRASTTISSGSELQRPLEPCDIPKTSRIFVLRP